MKDTRTIADDVFDAVDRAKGRPGMSDRIKEIRERVEKASKGPWEIAIFDPKVDPVEHFRQHLSFGQGDIHSVWCPEHPKTRGEHPRPDHAVLAAITGNGPESANNSDFVAHAREDVPYLLDLLAAKDAELGKLREIIDETTERLDRSIRALKPASKPGGPK